MEKTHIRLTRQAGRYGVADCDDRDLNKERESDRGQTQTQTRNGSGRRPWVVAAVMEGNPMHRIGSMRQWCRGCVHGYDPLSTQDQHYCAPAGPSRTSRRTGLKTSRTTTMNRMSYKRKMDERHRAGSTALGAYLAHAFDGEKCRRALSRHAHARAFVARCVSILGGESARCSPPSARFR